MAYASQQDAIDLYGESFVLTSVDRDDDGSVDETALDDALAQASSEMDSYLGVRYDVPVTPVPDVLIRRCVDIAIYICSPEAGTLTEEKTERYKQAIKWLQDVAAGKAEVPGAGDEDGSGVGQGKATAIITSPRLFTRSKMSGIL